MTPTFTTPPHPTFLRPLLAALIFALSGILVTSAQAQPGTLLEVTHQETVAPADIDRLGPPLFESFGTPRALHPVDVYRLRFESTDFDGSRAEISAQFFVPRMGAPSERPVYVFGSGTTGIGNQCAPSLEQPELRRWGHYRTNMLAYAGLGFIAIFPDYLGFNDETRPQRYFSARAEAHVMLDAIRAVYNFFGSELYGLYGTEQGATRTEVRPSTAVFAAGYSQGGHAAMAAADLRPSYAPEVPLSGVIAYGSTNDVGTLLREGPYYAPYIIYSYAQMHGYDEINPAALLQARWAGPLQTDVNRLCVDQFQQYYPRDGAALYTPAFHAALYGGTLARDFPALHARLEENKTGLSRHGLPALVVQGNQDIIITTPSQTAYVRKLCEAGSEVRYLRLDGVRHRHTRPAGFAESVGWMESVAQGVVPLSDCGGL